MSYFMQISKKICKFDLIPHMIVLVAWKQELEQFFLACEQALGGMEEKKRRACMHTSNFTVPPLFDISIIYAKYLAHNLGSATEMIIIIILVDDFITFNISYYKNYLRLSIKLQFNNRNTIYQYKVYWQDIF